MAISKQERINIEKLVVAMYNASLDLGYLGELTAAYEVNGRSLQQLAKDLSLTSSFQSLHPTNQTASQFASTFLTPYGLQADAEAIFFVTSKFDAGLNKGQIAYDAAFALDSYIGPSAAINAAKAIQNNKAEISEFYAVARSIPNPNITVLREIVATVTADPASVVTAKMNIGAFGPNGTPAINYDAFYAEAAVTLVGVYPDSMAAASDFTL